MDIDTTIIMTGGSVIIGGLITFLTSKYYYKKASIELRKEAEELRRLNRMMLLGMEHAGWVTLNKDAKGNIFGFAYKLDAQSGSIALSGSVAGLKHSKQEQ